MTTPALIAASTFDVSDIAIIIATLSGPVLAVQAQKWLEKVRAINDRRHLIFRMLMATRATRLSPQHVEALNAVPVEYYGTGRKLKGVVDAWHTYIDLLDNKNGLEGQVLALARQNAFFDMLHNMSSFLGYSFNRSQLEKDVYYPEGHKIIEDDQEVIRRGFAQLFKGEISLPMAVTEFPATADDQSLANQEALQKLLLEWLEGQRAVKVERHIADGQGGAE